MSVFRHELKYIVSTAQLVLLKTRIHGLMSLDPYAAANGGYNIRSLYFDDYHNRCFYENENGVDPREKYRIRIYNFFSGRIQLECKQKVRGRIRKTACPLSREEAETLLSGHYLTALEGRPSPLRELCAEMMLSHMRPVVIVEYERIPYIFKSGNVRVTFDTGVSSSDMLDAFFEHRIRKRPVLPMGTQLLEVKFDEYLPDMIYRALQLDELRQTAFSKYYLSRKFAL